MLFKNEFSVLHYFDDAPDSMLISINAACTIAARSRASIYRHIKAGDLSIVKVGHSSRIRVGNLRQLICGKEASK